MILQLGGEFDKEYDSTSCAAPLNIHGLKSSMGISSFSNSFRARLIKDVFPEPQGTKDADYKPLLGIKGKYVLNEILSGQKFYR